MKNLTFIFFALFFLPLISPYLGSIDVIAPQWLFLGLYNLFLFIYFFRNSILIPRSYIFYIYSFFIFQVILSLFYTKNLNVSIVDSSRFLIVFFTIYNIYYLIVKGDISFRKISLIICLFLLIEVVYSFIPFLSFLFQNELYVINQFPSIYEENFFIGFTGNKNITAASIAIKLPFLFYFLYSSRKIIVVLITMFISFFSFCLILLLKARSVFLSFSLVLLIFFIASIVLKRYKFFLILPILLLSFLCVSILTTKESNPVLNDIKSINFSASSSSDRFLLWDNAFSYILEHPIIGCGIGNWKIESLPYWNTHLSGYLVPYHAHNDFLGITTELGVFGGLTYIVFFFALCYTLFSLMYRFKEKPIRFSQTVVLFASLSVYIIDALLNFPFERPRQQIIFALLVSIIMLYKKRTKFI